MTLTAGEVFAGYTIVRSLGAGGMGEVYLAQHPRLPRREALKVLRPEISNDETFQQRFIREADSIAALEHPHVVTVHDRGDTDGRLWIATQYVDGTDAAKLLRDRYPAGMPADEVAVITAAIAEALDYAHGCGLLHRDVKPANILLSKPDQDGNRRVYLADFGIARPLEDPSGLTSTNFTVGTFAYSAPEQLVGKEMNGRADQYALAATAYHLLTGTALFPDSNPVAVISRHLTETPPPPSAIRPDLAAFDGVFKRALAKDPDDRFSSCRDFATAVTAAVAESGCYSPSAPTQEAPVPKAETKETTEPIRRSRSVSLIAAAAALLGGLTAGGALLWHPWSKSDPLAGSSSTPPPSITTATTTTPVSSSTPTSTTTPPPPPPTTTPAPQYPRAGALGEWCHNHGAIGTGPDGTLYYCSRLEGTEGDQWSLNPSYAPNKALEDFVRTSQANAAARWGPQPNEPCAVLGSIAYGSQGTVDCKQWVSGGVVIGQFWGPTPPGYGG